LDSHAHAADFLVVVGWGQVVDAIVVQVSEVRDHHRSHRYSLVVVEMHFLIQDELPPVSVSVVGRKNIRIPLQFRKKYL